MKWLENMDPGRFTLLVLSVFMVVTATTWAACHPRSDRYPVESTPVSITESDLRAEP